MPRRARRPFRWLWLRFARALFVWSPFSLEVTSDRASWKFSWLFRIDDSTIVLLWNELPGTCVWLSSQPDDEILFISGVWVPAILVPSLKRSMREIVEAYERRMR